GWRSRKVGLVARTVAPRPRTSPCTKHVFPAPSSPVSATTAPAPSVRPRRSPAASVSSGPAVTISVAGATELLERLRNRRDDVAGDQRFLADALRRDIPRAPLQVHARLQPGLAPQPAREKGAEHARENVAGPAAG